jgi:lysosomal acid phosphatase
VTIRSSDYERTLMSAYSNLLGLYPTSKEKLDEIMSEVEKEEKWPEVVPWQPIPVHTVPKPTDYVCRIL